MRRTSHQLSFEGTLMVVWSPSGVEAPEGNCLFVTCQASRDLLKTNKHRLKDHDEVYCLRQPFSLNLQPTAGIIHGWRVFLMLCIQWNRYEADCAGNKNPDGGKRRREDADGSRCSLI